MNKQQLFSSISLLAIILVWSCKPDVYKPLGKAVTPVTSLAGTWKLTSVIQKDEDAANKGFPYQTTDLTSVFPYTDFVLTLNMNGNTPTTFSTTTGNSPKIIRLPGGNWSIDDPAFPRVLSLINGTDTAKVTLGAYPTGASPYLEIALAKHAISSGKLLISYSYVFSKQ